MKKITQDEFNKVVELHVKWRNDEEGGVRAELFDVDFEGIDFTNANLRSADLRSADLSSADLRSADLRSADLRSANLSSADLSSADLRSADLRSADLRYADLRYADLRSADLSYADLRYADLRSADLRSADLVMIKADEYQVYINSKTMQVGCQNYTHAEWFSFDNDDIARMHACGDKGNADAVRRWNIWKPLLKTICDQLQANAKTKEEQPAEA